MNPLVHRIFILLMISLVVLTFLVLTYLGFTYYTIPLEQRFFYPGHELLKPSGLLGHGLGIVGSACMTVGVFSYMVRKRKKSLSRVGVLKNWLEFHIFLCTIGPIMVLFHTAFKFGGIVAVSFWSMVAVVLSGVIGRFIYNQIPRSIQGRELTLQEVIGMKNNATQELSHIRNSSGQSIEAILDQLSSRDTGKQQNSLIKNLYHDYRKEIQLYRAIKKTIANLDLSAAVRYRVMKLVKGELQLRRKINRLQTMQKLFRSWHVVHLPFALIMLVIMIIHVIITLSFGYKWIF
ncbi:MAG: hypothetical protein SH818_01965 [Saprospiraceae bacterium]|nr:hypothetical protein [Saprospiraceae bacterium]